jgi:hypothetical protein
MRKHNWKLISVRAGVTGLSAIYECAECGDTCKVQTSALPGVCRHEPKPFLELPPTHT